MVYVGVIVRVAVRGTVVVTVVASMRVIRGSKIFRIRVRVAPVVLVVAFFALTPAALGMEATSPRS